jgi:hypothetical protein
MYMPRLSLYKPEKGKDYKFLDKVILEMFTIGGTDLFVHKYIGTDDGNTVKDETQIQDLVFMENRDRKYDADIYTLRGIYNVQDIDFDLSQFGLFLSNDTLFMTIHINGSVETIGRKIMPGDVLELPHLRDEYAANDYKTALKRFYVVEDVNRASEGFSPTWYPHLYRIKLKQIVDSQEFADILNRPENEDLFEGEYTADKLYKAGQVVRYDSVLYEALVNSEGNLPTNTNFFKPYEENTLRTLLSTYEKEMAVSDGMVAEAELNAPKSGYDVDSVFYTLAVDEKGKAALKTADSTTVDAATTLGADAVYENPVKHGYQGYLIGDEFAPNGSNFGSGITFPPNGAEGDYFMRTDFMPKRLFRYDGRRWVKVHDVKRTSLSTSNPDTLRGSFINNINTFTYEDKVVTDFVRLTQGQTIIDTDIAFIQVPYIQLINENSTRDGALTLDFVVADYANFITSYTVNNEQRIRITLPAAITQAGLYTINLYNKRQNQRQALSQVLRPKADN